jgi:hypothetical protein
MLALNLLTPDVDAEGAVVNSRGRKLGRSRIPATSKKNEVTDNNR